MLVIRDLDAGEVADAGRTDALGEAQIRDLLKI
jgi:hypothetical protein